MKFLRCKSPKNLCYCLSFRLKPSDFKRFKNSIVFITIPESIKIAYKKQGGGHQFIHAVVPHKKLFTSRYFNSYRERKVPSGGKKGQCFGGQFESQLRVVFQYSSNSISTGEKKYHEMKRDAKFDFWHCIRIVNFCVVINEGQPDA